MTIETQVASLVTATNDLTETINGKVGEIDAAISHMNQVASDLPNGLLGVRTIYVDQVSGDDNAEDVDGAVVRTLDQALRRCKSFKVNNIALASNQTHLFENDIDLIGNPEAMGLETGYIYIYDRDNASNGSNLPTDASPILQWSAVLLTAKTIMFGGKGRSLTINHTTGCLNAMNPQAALGSGSPWTMAAIAHCMVNLNCNAGQYPLLNINGFVHIEGAAINKNVPAGRLTGDAPVIFLQRSSSYGGSLAPQGWDAVIGNQVGASVSQLEAKMDQRFAQVAVCNMHLDTSSGDDNNDGLSPNTPIRTANRLSQLLLSHGSLLQSVYISGSEDFVVDTPLYFTSNRATLWMQSFTGTMVFPALPIYDGSTHIGDGIAPISFFGLYNLVTLNSGTGTPRKKISLPSKSGHTGNGSSYSYDLQQGAFRLGLSRSAAPCHLTFAGADFEIGDHQSLVTPTLGRSETYQTSKTLVVQFQDCGSTVSSTDSNLLYGVVEATGTITDNWT